MLDNKSLIKFELSNVKNIDLEKSFDEVDNSTNNHIIHLYLIKDKYRKCPCCNSDFVKISGSVTTKFKHSSRFENNLLITLHKRTYKCINCGLNFREQNPIISETKTISIQKDLSILEDLKRVEITYSSIAKKHNVSSTYVINLFDKKVDITRKRMPKVLCIDEVYSDHLTKYKYCCVLYNPIQSEIIDILPSRHLNTLVEYFSGISNDEKNTIEYISMDMWNSYRILAKKCLPKAKIAVDSFHVIQQLNKAFNQIRIAVMKKFDETKQDNASYYWLYKKYWKLLLQNPENSSYVTHTDKRTGMLLSNLQIIDYMLEISPELRLAYELKEEYRLFNKAHEIEGSKENLNEFIFRFKNFDKYPFLEFGRMLDNWYDEILNSFNIVDGKRVSNGKLERVNRDIKTIFRMSYGSRNFPRTRNRILYSVNQNSSILNTRKTNIFKIKSLFKF